MINTIQQEKNYKKIAIEGEQIIEIPQMNNNIADLSCFYA